MTNARLAFRLGLALALTAACGGCRLRKSGVIDPKQAGGPCPSEGSIEDAEDGDGQIQTVAGRGGYAYTYADEKGTTVAPTGESFAPADGGANGSAHALRMSGKVAAGEDPYAGLGMSFRDPKAVYDGSRYAGVSFYAKVGQSSVRRVRFRVSDVNTDPIGKVCKDCYNDFGVELELTPEWKHYAIPFSALAQEPEWGSPRPAEVETAKLVGVSWQVATPGVFDLWVDDVAFTCR